MQEPVVFLVDDDPSVRRSLSRLISSAGYPVEAFSSAREFLNRNAADESGCILLDIRMPGINGIELQEELVLSGNPMPIIFMSAHASVPISVKAMKGGAVDFLTKPFSADELVSAIKNAVDKITKKRSEDFQIHEIKERITNLTPREYEVFRLVVQGLLNKQIGSQLGISEKTVKVHRSRVMEKMHAGSLAELVLFAQRSGIMSSNEMVSQ
jgi:two-component system, LuxR family, response regulator FixJ